ncbi:MAG TPA: DUF418 domain-containing protein, partial [Pilimelia sp.]|nr:DUF418 domain-containing protein [Pilimelia sp.]
MPRSVTRPLPTASHRIATVDALRGFALAGILIVNITYFASQHRGTGIVDAEFGAPVDRWAYLVVDTLFETKFYLLFSFLFGYSFTLQIGAATRRGAAFVPRFLRRVAGLFVIGAAHAVLLFHGDILMLYAVLALLLLPLRHLRPRTAALLGGGLLMAAFQLWMWWTVRVWDDGYPDGVDADAAAEAAGDAEVAYQGGFGDIVAQRWDDLV